MAQGTAPFGLGLLNEFAARGGSSPGRLDTSERQQNGGNGSVPLVGREGGGWTGEPCI